MLGKRGFFECFVILLVGAALMVTVTSAADRQLVAARDRYIEVSRSQSELVAHRVEEAFRLIHRDLRSLSLLPGVRALDRSGSGFGSETRALIEQMAVNLAGTASISGVYIAPAGFDPDRNGAAEAGEALPFVFGTGPAAGQAGCPVREGHRLRAALDWLAQHVPDRAAAESTGVPLVGVPLAGVPSGASCKTAGGEAAPDLPTLLFAVPVFGPDERFAGAVAAAMPGDALHELLPKRDFLLINPGYGFRSADPSAIGHGASAAWIGRAAPDPELIYSDVIGLDVRDARSPWSLWVGRPAAAFLTSAEARSVRFFEKAAYGCVAALTLCALVCAALLRRNAAITVAAEAKLEQRVSERTAAFRHQATHDALTGLPNRVALREKLDEAMARVRRGDRVALLCLDLDRFKAVNDTFGHPIGDALLKAVADRLRRCVREADVVARLGGDEFVIVQLIIERHDQAAALAQRIVDVVGADYGLDGLTVSIGTSIGIAFAPSDGDTSEVLMQHADLALYRAKHDGRGTYRFFDVAMDAKVQDRRQLEGELRSALQDQTFVLHYQPVADARTGTIRSFEALLRWRSPGGMLIAPSEFIPAAEDIGIMAPMGEWVINEACRAAARWAEPLGVSINVSAQQFKTYGLTQTVAEALLRSGLAPHRLELDVREAVLLADNRMALGILHELRSLGVGIALDDFGTGATSLGLLRAFRFDKIKIDRIFVQESAERADSVAILKTVASLGESLGLVTTAKGIETEAQLALVRRHGFAEVQGYLIGMPQPAEAIAGMSPEGEASEAAGAAGPRVEQAA